MIEPDSPSRALTGRDVRSALVAGACALVGQWAFQRFCDGYFFDLLAQPGGTNPDTLVVPAGPICLWGAAVAWLAYGIAAVILIALALDRGPWCRDGARVTALRFTVRSCRTAGLLLFGVVTLLLVLFNRFAV